MSAMPERGGEGNVAKGGNNPKKGGNECHVQGATVTMPEYIFIVPGFLGWTHLPDADGASVPYVPESRLLAAEARVREVEKERDVLLLEQSDREKLWQAEVDEYDAANATLRADLKAAQELEQLHLQNLDAAYAERDALVPLLRYFVEYVEDGEGEDGPPRHQCEFTLRPEKGYCEFHDKWGQARAILAREAGA